MHENLFALNLLTVSWLLVVSTGAGRWEIGQWTTQTSSKDLTVSFQEETRNQHLWNTCCMPETLPELLASIHSQHQPCKLVYFLYISKLRLREVIYFTQNHMVKSEDSECIPWSNSKICAMTTFFQELNRHRGHNPNLSFLLSSVFLPAHLHGKKKKRMNAVLFVEKQIRVFFQNNMWSSF